MNLTNHFLIAMPAMDDPNFSRTVTYVFAHGEDGATGLVINRPAGLDLGTVLDQTGIEAAPNSEGEAARRLPVMEGGPVMKERGFVLHRPAGTWEHALTVAGNDVAIAMSRDILDAIANGQGPKNVLVLLGYAGWGPGQLEHEMGENAWLSQPADMEVLFEAPFDERWELAARRLGIELHQLSGEAGHA